MSTWPNAPKTAGRAKPRNLSRGLTASQIRSGRTNVLQYAFAEQVGIAFATIGKLNDLLGNGLLHVVVAIPRPQTGADKFEGNTEDALSLFFC